MIHAVEVNLAERGVVFPRTGVGMVIAQPYWDSTQQEPFTCTSATKQRQLEAVKATLRVSRLASHGAEKTHFTIFPEYSIPGLEGVAIIDEAVADPDWPVCTVVIGGVDGLTRDKFTELVRVDRTHIDVEHNNLDRVQASDWVNCSVTWIKLPNGDVERWIQPKIAAAWAEQNLQYQEMFQGRSVFVFNGMFDDNASPYRFCSFLCFDWIADIDGKRVWRWIVANLGQGAAAANMQIPLTWVFVVQSNPQPSHASFLAQIECFFDQTIEANVRRDKACLVMANTAGSCHAGRVAKYGETAVLHSAAALFSKPLCAPTYCSGGPKKRAGVQLGQINDALFREGGACIHSFLQINPASLVAGAAGKTSALSHPYVYPLDEKLDQRTPSAVVPACIKWLNDDLDYADGLAKRFPNQPLSAQAAASHSTSVERLRTIEPTAAENVIQLACPKSGRTADDWDVVEEKALEHVIQTLTVFDIAKKVNTILGQPSHATIVLADKPVDVVAIRADSHENCAQHLKDYPLRTRLPIVLVSRDEENTEWPRWIQSFLNTPSENFGEINITDPAESVHCVGYRTIMDAFRNAQTEENLIGALDDILVA